MDIDDFVKFSPVAFRLGVKKSFLIEKDTRNYYSLFGNLLYVYDREDASSFSNIYFLESSSVKKSPVTNSSASLQSFSVTTVGGKLITFQASSASEMQDWIDAIDSNKFVALTRKFEDMESQSMQAHYRVDQQERRIVELESQLEQRTAEITSYTNQLDDRDARIRSLELEIQDKNGVLRKVENERLLLLNCKGVTPKVVPTWAISRDALGNVTDLLKLWVGTWNLR